MPSPTIDTLNERHALPDHVHFAAGPGGFPVIAVRNAHATATIALQGATVLAYQPQGQEPVLWVSRQAVFAPDRAIRGGIPVCWPWFGPHPTDPAKPQHGVARTRPWTVLSTAAAPDGSTMVRLGLQDTTDTRVLWPHAFTLALVVTIGPALQVGLEARNSGVQPFACSGALHTYLRVGNVEEAVIHGLEGFTYVDLVDARRLRLQPVPVHIVDETDRIYERSTGACALHDPVLRRRIVVERGGAFATVIWNPWRDKARALADMGDDEYTGMVCVEVADPPDDPVVVMPGETHRLATTISVEPGP